MWQDALTCLFLCFANATLLAHRYTHRYTGQPSLDQPLRPIDTAFMLELIVVCFLHKSQTHDYKLQHESSIDGAQRLIEGWLSSIPMSTAMSEESSVRKAEE